MDLDKVFSTDVSLEEEGVWITLDEASAIKIARLNNKAFKQLAAKIGKQSKIIAKHTDDIPEETLIHLIAKTILLDWKGIKVKGKEVVYSVENAIKFMTEYKDFRDLVIELANEKETFRRAEIEENKEKLKKS
jgi:hypothetical protein